MGLDSRPAVLGWLDPLRRSWPVPALYSGLTDDAREQIRLRREGRRLLAEAVRVHLDDPDAALRALQDSPIGLSRDPRTAVFVDYVSEAVIFRAQSRLQVEDVKGALEMLRRIPTSATCYVAARLLLGQTLEMRGQGEEARVVLMGARQADPKSYDAAAALARHHQIRKEYDQAARAWVDAIALRPDLSVPHVQLSLCYWRLNRLEEARDACRRALQLDPKDVRAAELLENLGKP
jgi:tetratricopeptide (TPR) repeat protein